jgi:hypothetical protein
MTKAQSLKFRRGRDNAPIELHDVDNPFNNEPDYEQRGQIIYEPRKSGPDSQGLYQSTQHQTLDRSSNLTIGQHSRTL